WSSWRAWAVRSRPVGPFAPKTTSFIENSCGSGIAGSVRMGRTTCPRSDSPRHRYEASGSAVRGHRIGGRIVVLTMNTTERITAAWAQDRAYLRAVASRILADPVE